MSFIITEELRCRHNNIAQKVLGFKSPNEYIAEYFLNKLLGGCVTNV